MTDRTRYRWATVKVVGRASCSGSETDVMVLGTAGPEAVQNTGLTRFRQPRFLDITYTLGYVWWFLPGTLPCCICYRADRRPRSFRG